MLKRFLLISLFLFATCFVVQAAENKIAVIDLQKVINNSAQVQSLRKEQEKNNKEIAQLVKKAGDEIKKETDSAKKKAIVEKYDKQIKAKREAFSKTYRTKLEAVDKNINMTITQQAKAMGYDMVITKGVVLYGGDDITEVVCKVVK